jgi:hypothetical protein
MPKNAARSGRGIDVLLYDLQVHGRLLDLVGDVGKVTQGAVEAIQARHDERITGAHSIARMPRAAVYQ